MPLARRKRVEGVSRFGRDSVAIRSRFGRVDARGKAQRRQNVAKNGIDFGFGRDSVAIGRDSMPEARRKDGKTSRKVDFVFGFGRDSVAIRSRFGRDSVAIRSRFGRADTEDKAQRRQNVAKS